MFQFLFVLTVEINSLYSKIWSMTFWNKFIYLGYYFFFEFSNTFVK